MSQLHRQASMCVQKRVSPNTGGNCLQVECRSCGCDQPVRPATRSLQNVNLSWSAKIEASRHRDFQQLKIVRVFCQLVLRVRGHNEGVACGQPCVLSLAVEREFSLKHEHKQQLSFAAGSLRLSFTERTDNSGPCQVIRCCGYS